MKKKYLLLLLIPFLFAGVSFAGVSIVGTMWKQIGTIVSPADDVTGIDFRNITSTIIFNTISSASSNASGGGALDLIILRDEKSQNVSGGTCTAGSFQTRTINVESVDTGGFANVSSNSQFIFQPGTYRFFSSAPAHGVERHQTRLYNITDAVVISVGTSEITSASGSHATRSFIDTRFNLSVANALELQHRCQATLGTNGFGVANNFTTEVYSIIRAERE